MHDRRTLSAVRSDEIGRDRFGAWVSMSRLPRYMNLPSMPLPLSESCFLGPMCALLVLRRSVFLVMHCHSEGSSGSVLAWPTFPTRIRKAATIRSNIQRFVRAILVTTPNHNGFGWYAILGTGVHVPSNCDPLYFLQRANGTPLPPNHQLGQ